jgi:hypothetical protein
MNTNNIDTEIEYCESQLKLATCDDAICEYNYELTNLRFKKHLELLKQKVNKITTRQPSVLDLFHKYFPI